MRGVVLDRESFDAGDLDLSALEAALPEWRHFEATAPEDTAARVAEAEVVVSNKVVLDAAVLEQAPRLRLVAVAATGTNNVDLEAAAERGVTVCNARAYANPSVVQHVLGVILALTRRLPEYGAAVRDGAWGRGRQFCLLDYPMRELGGRALAVVGWGELGRSVGRTAEAALGMELLVSEHRGRTPRPGRLAFEECLERADVLTLHCPLTPDTAGLIGEAELARMKDDALLINAARGGIVDEPALAAALRAGRLGGAAVDVLTEEPPRHGNPLLEPDIPNLIVTPHVAWASRESRQRLMDQVAENIRAFLAGTPRNVVGTA